MGTTFVRTYAANKEVFMELMQKRTRTYFYCWFSTATKYFDILLLLFFFQTVKQNNIVYSCNFGLGSTINTVVIDKRLYKNGKIVISSL
jgi:hypothetical protein